MSELAVNVGSAVLARADKPSGCMFCEYVNVLTASNGPAAPATGRANAHASAANANSNRTLVIGAPLSDLTESTAAATGIRRAEPSWQLLPGSAIFTPPRRLPL